MKYIEGYWWPDDCGTKYKASLRKVKSLKEIIRLSGEYERRRLVIQAGGSYGVWPRLLSKYFQEVHTFEPDEISYVCLKKNVGNFNNITTYQVALGEKIRWVAIKHKSLTSHHVIPGNIVKLMPIDSYLWSHCDAILLDIEGYEIHALCGAIETIRKYRPFILTEKPFEDVETFMEEQNYAKYIVIQNDTIWTPYY